MNNATQDNIHIAGIKDGIVILKSGGYRLILQVGATNFSLKSDEEQNSIIFQYQSFLNSLHFPIEIVMQSKKLDLTPYLKKVSDKMEKQTNELLKMQMQDYIEFVGKLINVANIMKKTFYVVIPYEPLNLKNVSLFDKLFGGGKPASSMKISESEFKHHSEEIIQRANTVAGGLGGLGLHCVQLNTEQIVELFYKVYNPELAGRERFEDTNAITSPIVSTKQEGQGSQNAAIDRDKGKVIDNSAVVAETQKQQTQDEKIKEMQERSYQVAANTTVNDSGQKVIENKAAGMNDVEAQAQTNPAQDQQPPSATNG